MVETKRGIREAAKGAAHVFAIVAGITPAEEGAPAPTPTLPYEYADLGRVFSKEEAGKLPEEDGPHHAIDLEDGDEVPPWMPIYSLAEKELQVLREYLQDMLSRGWIRPSSSAAGAPVLFVPKKGGQLRLCVDYRGLNKVTKKNRAPLPLISEILDRLRGARWYTKVDLKDAYHRIRIRPGDEWKTAFRCRYGHFEYTVMPFGLANAPATFQTYINEAMSGLVDNICIVYLDDILIYSDDLASHQRHVRSVLERLEQFGLYANLAKCSFHQQEVGFLGFIVDNEGVKMEPSRVTAINEWPEPQTTKDIQQFLGFAGFYRRFIRNYSHVSSALSDCLKGGHSGRADMGKGGSEAFRAIQKAFTEAPLLRHYDPELPTRVETDASGYALGAILTQLSEGRWHPVAFMSKKLVGAELRYDTPSSELMAIVVSFRTWRHYLAYLDEPVEVLTDHLNHQSLATKTRLSSREARWMEELAPFRFVIKYREGKKNPADGLSRRPDYCDPTGQKLARQEPLDAFLLRFGEGEAQKAETDTRRLDPGRPAIQCLRGRLNLMDPVVADAGSSETGTRRLDPGNPAIQRLRERLKYANPSEFGMGSFERCGTFLSHRKRRPEGEGQPGRQGATLEALVHSIDKGVTLPEAVGYVRRVSRIPATAEDQLPSMAEAILGAQRGDAFVSAQGWRQRNNRPYAGVPLWHISEADGLLRRGDSVYVPESLRKEVMKAFHDDPTSGHKGGRKTKKALRRRYYWDGLGKNVDDMVNRCLACQRMKPRTHKPYGKLAPLPAPSRPWEEISLDFVTGLPLSENLSGKYCDAILVVVDRFTKYALYIPTTCELTAEGLADILLHHVFRMFGIPGGIVSDRGSLFTSGFWTTLCRRLGIARRLSTAYHPQTDGQTERQHQSLEHYLRTYCTDEQDN